MWASRWSAIDPVSTNGAPQRAAPLELDFVTGGIIRDEPLSWREVAAVAEGAALSLSDASLRRVADARGLVETIVAQGIRAYGVNTAVGALCDVVVRTSQLLHFTRNIVMSHALGMRRP